MIASSQLLTVFSPPCQENLATSVVAHQSTICPTPLKPQYPQFIIKTNPVSLKISTNSLILNHSFEKVTFIIKDDFHYNTNFVNFRRIRIIDYLYYRNGSKPYNRNKDIKMLQ